MRQTTIQQTRRRWRAAVSATKTNTAPASAGRCSDPPGSLLPLTEAAAPPADPQYQNPWAGDFARSLPGAVPEAALAVAWADRAGQKGVGSAWADRKREPWDGFRKAPEADMEAPRVAAALEAASGAPACGGSCHPAVGYNGYTYGHLPRIFCSAPDWSREEAVPAIFAARMARSSFSTRPWLKYGERALSRFC